MKMPHMFEVNADFEYNWKEFLYQKLEDAGYAPDYSRSVDEIGYQYFNLRRRLISEVPREILKSNDFTCPDNLKEGLQFLEQKIRSGVSIQPHLSKNSRKLTKTDPLLNHWGIHHLHLGTTLKNNGLVERTGPVLFARFDEKYAYFICVMEHGGGHNPWSKQDLVKILHRNWPESIKSYLVRGGLGLNTCLSDDDVKLLRESGAVTFTEPERGIVYAPIGGGYSTAQTSVEARISSDRWLNAIHSSEIYLRDNIANIAKIIYEETGKKIGPRTKFLLGINGLEIYAFEVRSRVFFKLTNL